MKQPKKVSDIIKHLEEGGTVRYHNGIDNKVDYLTVTGFMRSRPNCGNYLLNLELLKPTKKITLYAFINEAGYLRHSTKGDSIAKACGYTRIPSLDKTVEVEA